MDTGQQLFAAIMADPLDDAPRLMYADWLDENGEPERAKFIRDQIRAGDTADSLRIGRGGIRALTKTEPWKMDLRRVTTPGCVCIENSGDSSVIFKRGFIDCITISPYEFYNRGAYKLAALHPITKIISTRGIRVVRAPDNQLALQPYGQYSIKIFLDASPKIRGASEFFLLKGYYRSVANLARNLVDLPPIKDS